VTLLSVVKRRTYNVVKRRTFDVFVRSKMKESGSWPKDLTFTKCSDFTAKDAIVRTNLDLRQALKTVAAEKPPSLI
jgi:hypothetical protein